MVDLLCPFCDTPFRTDKTAIISGHTQSCGCLRVQTGQRVNLRHGHNGNLVSPTHRSWSTMWTRCTNPHNDNYKYYGGRGIAIHSEWGKFENFLRDMGQRPTNKTLDRINNNEGYELNNCRWATKSQQMKNRRKL